MPKKNNAGGCGCCCGPVTERVDEFDSLWPCFLGMPNAYAIAVGGDTGSTSYSPVGSGWSVSGGQLIYSRPASLPTTHDPLIVDAIRLPVPYSMELILEADELNLVSGDQALLNLQMHDGGDGTNRISGGVTAGIVGSLSPIVSKVMSGAGGLQAYTNPITMLPCEIWYKLQVDTDGISHWLWIDGVKPSGVTWGTKTSATPPSLTGIRKRYWSLHVRNASGARANWAKFNRLEVREWDHTSITMPDPDNP